MGLFEIDAQYSNLVQWFIVVVRLDIFYGSADVHPIRDSSKYSVLVIEPGCRNRSDEKLRPVGIWTCICH